MIKFAIIQIQPTPSITPVNSNNTDNIIDLIFDNNNRLQNTNASTHANNIHTPQENSSLFCQTATLLIQLSEVLVHPSRSTNRSKKYHTKHNKVCIHRDCFTSRNHCVHYRFYHRSSGHKQKSGNRKKLLEREFETRQEFV